MILNEEKRTKLLQILLKDDELLLLNNRAEKEGMPLSTFVRGMALEYYKKTNKRE